MDDAGSSPVAASIPPPALFLSAGFFVSGLFKKSQQKTGNPCFRIPSDLEVIDEQQLQSDSNIAVQAIIVNMRLVVFLVAFSGLALGDTYQVTATFTQPQNSCQNTECESPVTVSFTYHASSIVVGVPQMLTITPQQMTVTWNSACLIPNSSPAMYYCADNYLNAGFSVSAVGASGVANFVFYWTAFGVSQSIQATISNAVYVSAGNYTGIGGSVTVTDVGP